MVGTWGTTMITCASEIWGIATKGNQYYVDRKRKKTTTMQCTVRCIKNNLVMIINLIILHSVKDTWKTQHIVCQF